MQRHGSFALSSIALLALGVFACDKNSSAKPDEAKAVVNAIDKSEKKNGADTASSGKPMPGVSLDKLDTQQKKLFNKLADSLGSPCGKAHSLRTSASAGSNCKRARYAARYLVSLIRDDFEASDIREMYNDKYGRATIHKFDLKDVPHHGPTDARVVIVEFFDYGCPACKQFKPILEKARGEFPQDAVIYYKNFPLSAHPNSGMAAQAALAAAQQGKFDEMHAKLFENSHNHAKSDLQKYAKEIGLDLARFESDFTAAAPRVERDKGEGDKAGVAGTPTLYINGREYKAPGHPRYIKMWIDEELAVNR